MKKQLKNNIWWIGKTDWQTRRFHGDEYSTNRGTTYNSYLIMEEKTALIDTVFAPFSNEFIRNLAQEIDLKKIDYIIVNHAETDHSGALPELMSYIPETPIYCTANGVKSIKGHYHKGWNFNVVKTGDKLSLGNKELVFISAPMLHWPDTMMSYLTGDNVLFSNDAFGQHYANEGLYNDLVDQCELYEEAIKYYANILTPFSQLVERKINEVVSLNLPIDMICTSHGVIWRDNPLQIVYKYLEWAKQYQENQIAIIYDTMWNGTKILAENIAKGIREKDTNVRIKIFNSSNTDKNDLITEIFRSKAILVGSPTINNGILTSVAGMLEMIKGMKFKGKKAASFGCYGWHSESVSIIQKHLEESGFEIMAEGYKALWNPDDEAIKGAVNFGQEIAAKNLGV